MLLSSALPLDQRASSVVSNASSTQQSGSFLLNPSALFSPLRSPEPSSPSIISPNGLFQTCRRLHQILSVDRSCSPGPSLLPAAPIRKTSQPIAETPVVERCSAPILAPAPVEVAKTPQRSNKRTRTMAFDSPESAAEEERRKRDLFSTPIQKRIRLSTPCAPGRGRSRQNYDSNSDVETNSEEETNWTAKDDQQLVEMVLGKLNLSQDDWEQCAKTLGKKDVKAVGKRWEGLLGEVVLKKDRRRNGRVTAGPSSAANKRRRIKPY